MQHLCYGSLSGTLSSHPASVHVKGRYGSSRCIELIHIIHRLCGSPSIPLSFNLAAVLPRRSTSRVSFVTKEVAFPNNQLTSFRAWTTRVSNPVCSPRFRALSVSVGPGGCLRHRCSSTSLRISLLHVEFHLPLPHSSLSVLNAIPRLSPGLSHQA